LKLSRGAKEAEKKLSSLVPSVWELSGDVCIFREELLQESGRDPGSVFDV